MRRRLLLLGLAAALGSGCGGSRQPASAPAQEQSAPEDDGAGVDGEARQMEATDEEPGEAEMSAPPPASAPAGAAAPSSMQAEEGGADDAAMDRLLALQRDLGGALSLSTPDCGRAGMIRDQICDIASAICRMADDEDAPEIQSRCTDARSRCDHARRRVGTSCAR